MSNAQYIRREILEEKVCEALSSAGTEVKPDEVNVCHTMKKKDKVIIKFMNRKDKKDVIFKRKELKSKGDDLLVDHYLLMTPCVSKTRFSFINARS